MNGLDCCLVSFVPASFIGSSGGGIAQVVHRSAVEQVVTLTAGVTVILVRDALDQGPYIMIHVRCTSINAVRISVTLNYCTAFR